MQNESKTQITSPNLDSRSSELKWMASTNHRVRALRSSGGRVVRHHSSTSRTIPTVWLALPGPHALSPACTHDLSRCESESRPATGVSPLASATRWGSTPQRVCRRSNHRDLSRTLGMAAVRPRLLESLSCPSGGMLAAAVSLPPFDFSATAADKLWLCRHLHRSLSRPMPLVLSPDAVFRSRFSLLVV